MTNEEVIQKAHEEFALRGLSHYTAEEYLGTLRIFLRYYENRPLETMGEQEIRSFLLCQIEVGKTPGCVNNYNSAVRFIFGAVLERNLNCRMIPRQRDRRDIPAIMSKYEVCPFFSVINNLRDKAMFETVYGAGPRVSKIVHLRVQDIDSKQMRIFIHQGKEGRDRFTLLSQRNLDLLRECWKQYRLNHSEGYLFYARSKDKHILITRSVQNAFNNYKTMAHLPESYSSYAAALFCHPSSRIRSRSLPDQRIVGTYIYSNHGFLSSLEQHE